MTTCQAASSEFVPGTSRETRTGHTLRSDLIAQIVRTTPDIEGLVITALDEQRKKEIGERIKALRKERRITQPALAELLGYRTVRGYQKAEQTGGMEYERYEKLAEAFGVPVDYILRGDANGDGPAEGSGQIADLAAQVADLARTTAELVATVQRLETQIQQMPAQRTSDPKKKKRGDD